MLYPVWILVASLVLVTALGFQSSHPHPDKIDKFPGQPHNLNISAYGGYINVDSEAGRELYYVYVEAEHEPETAPVVLWLNGGPGCSSLGGGLMSELGPFFPTKDGSGLVRNVHRWNKLAHMIFLESPAFVGFSYSNATSDAVTGDKRTAEDSVAFLEGFMHRYKHLSNHPLYLAGESYAGHYVPNLAAAILEHNGEGDSDGTETNSAIEHHHHHKKKKHHHHHKKLKLEGFLVGNAWTDASIDNHGAVDFWNAHALISQPTADGVTAKCDFARVGPLDEDNEVATSELLGVGHHHKKKKKRRQECNKFVNRAFTEMGDINIYDIYVNVCYPVRASGASKRLSRALFGRAPSLHRSSSTPRDAPFTQDRFVDAAHGVDTLQSALEQALWMRSLAAQEEEEAGWASYWAASVADGVGHYGDDPSGSSPTYDPCIDDEVAIYLNKPEVQAAMHVNVTGGVAGPWKDCSDRVDYSRSDLLSSMLPVYEQLLQSGLRILVYSGDVDAIVPVTGTRRWIAGLELPVLSPWQPWILDGQVGGYEVVYDGLSFATVRNAGHMVPYTQPARAFALFERYLNGTSIAASG